LRLTENTLTTVAQVINQMPEKTRTVLINSVTRFGNLVYQDGNGTHGPWSVELKNNSALNGQLQVAQVEYEGLHAQGAIFSFDMNGSLIAHLVSQRTNAGKPVSHSQGQAKLGTSGKLRGAVTMKATQNKGLYWSLRPARNSQLLLSGKIIMQDLPELVLNETIRFNKPIATLVRDPVRETFPFSSPMNGWRGMIRLDFEEAYIDKKHQVFLSIRPQFKIFPAK
jgi:glutamine phosphoribosylpyrophosphate amidotransferase